MTKNHLTNHFLIKRVVLAMALTMLAAGFGKAEALVALKGHVAAQTLRSAKIDRVQADEKVGLSLVINIDQNLLDQTIESLYGKGAPAHKRFLSASEFAQKFGLSDKRQALKNFALTNGLTIDSTDDQPESMIVKVSGPARNVETAFHVALNHYRDTKGRLFRAQETDPMIPASLAPHLGAVMGLTNITGVYHPHFRLDKGALQRIPMAKASSTNSTSVPHNGPGSGPSGYLIPSDIKTIYGLSQLSLTGAGQKVALFELDGYDPTDVALYKGLFSLANTPVTFIGVDGTSNLCGTPTHNQSCSVTDPTVDTDMVEVALDIDMVLALASGVSEIAVYDGPNTGQGIFDLYNKITTDNTCQVVSTSWGADEIATGASFAQAEAQLFQRMAAQGQTIYAASGDLGAYDQGGNTVLVVDDPASQPFVTGVGGTHVTGTINAPTETVWNSGFDVAKNRFDASGGGISSIWPIPSYQSGVAGLASTQFRNVPDVALNADPTSGYVIVVGGLVSGVGGTSAAAPLWAAMTALLNQQSVAGGGSSLGFANPALYQLGTTSSSSSVFTDIRSGNNGFYSASEGYDNATGLGSFKGSGLISSVTGQLILLSKENLANVYAYPNPWDIRKHGARLVTLANIPDDATVKLFTLSGFWVKNLTPVNGRAVWDLTNNNGSHVASGIYFYLVTTPDAQTKGEIAIIK